MSSADSAATPIVRQTVAAQVPRLLAPCGRARSTRRANRHAQAGAIGLVEQTVGRRALTRRQPPSAMRASGSQRARGDGFGTGRRRAPSRSRGRRAPPPTRRPRARCRAASARGRRDGPRKSRGSSGKPRVSTRADPGREGPSAQRSEPDPEHPRPRSARELARTTGSGRERLKFCVLPPERGAHVGHRVVRARPET
jgi:hypothetical protein